MRQPVALTAQIDELTRVLSFRQATHASMVRSGQISKIVSDAQIERTEYALKTLRFVRDNADKIRAAVGTLPWEVRA